MEREWLSPVDDEAFIASQPDSFVFAALSCSRRDAHQSDRVGEAFGQTRQACGRQAWFNVQVDVLIVSVQVVVGLVPIEQISNVLSVGHVFHRSEH